MDPATTDEEAPYDTDEVSIFSDFSSTIGEDDREEEPLYENSPPQEESDDPPLYENISEHRPPLPPKPRVLQLHVDVQPGGSGTSSISSGVTSSLTPPEVPSPPAVAQDSASLTRLSGSTTIIAITTNKEKRKGSSMATGVFAAECVTVDSNPSSLEETCEVTGKGPAR